MSDPRYPASFQRPDGRTPADAPAPPAPVQPPVQASVPAPKPRPLASTRPVDPAEPTARGGNRIVLLGASDDEPDTELPASRRNLALGGLYALAAALLALALLGGMWSQGVLRQGDQFGWSTGLNPDGLAQFAFEGEGAELIPITRLLVQLAPTTLALGVLALLVAIALPVLTRRPR